MFKLQQTTNISDWNMILSMILERTGLHFGVQLASLILLFPSPVRLGTAVHPSLLLLYVDGMWDLPLDTFKTVF